MILLTEKDADFIANIARKELDSTNNIYEALSRQIEAKKENMEKMLSLIELDEIRNSHKEELDAAYLLAKNALDNKIFAIAKEFTKIIELMTSGSPLENSND